MRDQRECVSFLAPAFHIRVERADPVRIRTGAFLENKLRNEGSKCMSRLFINLSNHPSGQWDDPQRNAAMRYGQIVDLPFPEVPPEMGEDDVKTVAMNFYGKIRRLAHKYCNGDSSQVTVMLQGEFTLVYILTKMLRADGIRVVSGCTERESRSVRNSDGSVRKVSVFRFVRFREYA